MRDYEDIINLPHYKSLTRTPMSMRDRAAQFAPFAALTGYDDAIDETARLTDEKLNISDDKVEKINNCLDYIKKHQKEGVAVNLVYFMHDPRKKGGIYMRYEGRVKSIDELNGYISLDDGKSVNIDDIYHISRR